MTMKDLKIYYQAKRNISTESKEPQHQEKNISDANEQVSDYQQPSDPTENDINTQHKDAYIETERNSENIKFEFGKYIDVSSWPVSLNIDFINHILSHEMTDFQNKDPENKYPASTKKYKDQNRSLSDR